MLIQYEALYHVVYMKGRTDLKDDLLRDGSKVSVRLVLNDEATAIVACGKPPLLSFVIRQTGLVDDLQNGRKGIPKLTSIMEATHPGIRYIWVPIKLMKIGRLHTHSNAISIDNFEKTLHLFEPHGSNFAVQGHPATFQNYYHATSYYNSFKTEVGRLACFSGYKIYVPTDYEPWVFGQSVSNVYPDTGADQWCSLWSLLFLVYSTKRSPAYFIEFVCHLSTRKCLNTWLIHMLRTYKTWMTVPELLRKDMQYPGDGVKGSNVPPKLNAEELSPN